MKKDENRCQMIRLGEIQQLEVVKKVEFGVYLADTDSVKAGTEYRGEKVLLPAKQVPDHTGIGDKIEIFAYKDSKDRLIATTRRPKLILGEVGELRVAQVGKIGAFLDWGLEKELLLPFKEQTKRVKEGETVLAAVYIDKSSRLCATMNVYQYLDRNSPYQKEDKVSGRVYQISEEFGAFVAVDNRYSGLIPQKELYGNVAIGDEVSARVTEVKEDGKLDLSIREKAYIQIGIDAEKVMEIIESFDGVLPFNDKARPETIKRETGMSKNEFKRAVGNLLKAGRIEITQTCIRKIK